MTDGGVAALPAALDARDAVAVAALLEGVEAVDTTVEDVREETTVVLLAEPVLLVVSEAVAAVAGTGDDVAALVVTVGAVAVAVAPQAVRNPQRASATSRTSMKRTRVPIR